MAIFPFISAVLFAQPAVELTEIVSGLSQPTDIASTPVLPDRLFIAQKTGQVRVVDLTTNTLLPGNYTTVANDISTNSERGLLGMAFHPDFASTRAFYLHFSSDGEGSLPRGTSVIRRYVVDDVQAPFATATLSTVLTLEQDFANHNGGDLAFGPDGFLYIGFGDGGNAGDPNDRAQQRSSWLGKMLRIDVDNPADGRQYGIPADNPFVGDNSTEDEIWALGLRNPWRFSFDRLTGDLWIGDVGQNAREEVNFQPAASTGGENYGWDCREGDIAFGSSSDECDPAITYTDPVVALRHSNPLQAQSITGGYVYRGQRWPELEGTYVCADFVTNNLFTIIPDGAEGWTLKTQSNLPIDRVSTFGESASGELYLADFGGRLYAVGGGSPNSTTTFVEENSLSLEIFPNPAKELLTVRVLVDQRPNIDDYVLTMVDALGQTVKRQAWTGTDAPTTFSIPVNDLTPGVYGLTLRIGKSVIGRLVVVE